MRLTSSAKRSPTLAEAHTEAAPYAAPYAELYDLFYRDKPYAQEVEFLRWVLHEQGVAENGRLLELACGTGEHATRLAGLGYEVIATDASSAMVELARAKAAQRAPTPTFVQSDMRRPPGPSFPFDAAICLFDSIGYVQTDQAIAEVLDAVHSRLRSGGVFVFEFWHGPAMTKSFEPVRVRRFRRDGSTILRISETELEPERSLAHVSYDVYELGDDGAYRHFSERHSNRYFDVPEFEALGRAHGFAPLAAYDGFRRAAATNETWHVLAAWRRRP
jgi:SAM-dependent methyltransferase